ncbi:polysaccharide deacetylase family protein [Paractinoplanes ferrugineus]|uniref:Endo-1,4-beta-xylanase n=1 Tax=Paractinoplanes ferrugineus TaxID=113564 RepID=A0A919ITS1_9ACTN|nr:polysaccharide deacetylase family protein [Actinoplanes ferrugineus]GIE08891.1 endo-1,4-beta-xylanase [Actinoplanes ferrugineus]
MTEAPPRQVVVTTSWDDGHRLDDRLAALLAKYAIPATFYLAPRNVEWRPADLLSPAGVRDLADRFEIGGHTMTHRRLPTLSDAAARADIQAGKEHLEDIIGEPLTSFCYPCGDYTQAHVRITGELGFTLARTVRRSTLQPGSPLEMDTTVNAYAHRVDGPLALRMARGRPWTAAKLFLSWDELAIKWFETCRTEGGVFHLWGHSWEVDARGDWQRLERVLEHVSGRPDVTYVANRDLLALGV